MIELPTPAQLAVIEEEELSSLAVAWRTRALHGDKDAYGVAHALEVEQRRRARESQLQPLPPESVAAPRPWWRFWQGGAGTGSANDDPTSST